jgi:hypothetical protein
MACMSSSFLPHWKTWLQRFECAHGEAQLFDLLRPLYSRTNLCLPRDELADLRARGMAFLAEQRLDALKKRFYDLSLFVKEVKERFSRWFNKRRGRRGTLWMDRFKSVIVESKGEAPAHDGGLHRSQPHACGSGQKPARLPLVRLCRGPGRQPEGAR